MTRRLAPASEAAVPATRTNRVDEAASAAIAARLERLPLTSYQRGIFLIIATAWFFDSIDLGSLTFVLGSIRTEFGLSSAQAGLLSSMSFLGMFLGASLAGMLADRYGRKPVFQVSMIFWGLGSLWCAFAPDARSLGYARLLLGFGMGMEFPVALAIVSEIIPAAKRGRYMAILEGFWPLGFITAGLLSLLLLSWFDWRSVFLCQAIPAVFVFVIRMYVPESPRWLAERGRHEEAGLLMAKIEAAVRQRLGGRELPPAVTAPPTGPAAVRRFSFLGALDRPLRPPHRDDLAPLVLCPARLLRAHHLAGRAPAGGRLQRHEVSLLHDPDLARGPAGLRRRRLADRGLGQEAHLRAHAARQRRRRLLLRPRGEPGPAHRLRALHAVLPVRHVVGPLRLHA